MHDKAVYCFSVVHAKVGKEGTMNYNCLFDIIYKNCSLLDICKKIYIPNEQ